MRTGEARRWMVAIALCALGWMGAAGGASAQEEGPPPGKVRISLLSPDERALKLFIVSGPEGTVPGEVCKLPCEVDLAPGTYRVRFRKRALIRSWPRTFTVTSSGAYSLTYRSRQGWRGLGGTILLLAAIWAGWWLSYVVIAAKLWGLGGVLMVTAVALGPAVVIGVPVMLLPDRAHVVPIR
jgi:hypothetical protein